MAPKSTDDPKDVRLEIRLTKDIENKLDDCREKLNYSSNAEVVRESIERMYNHANREKELRDAYASRKELIEVAENERAQMVYDEAYDEAYEDAYAEEYAELIIDPDYTPSSAKEAAEESAKDRAKEAAEEAVKEFWNT